MVYWLNMENLDHPMKRLRNDACPPMRMPHPPVQEQQAYNKLPVPVRSQSRHSYQPSGFSTPTQGQPSLPFHSPLSSFNRGTARSPTDQEHEQQQEQQEQQQHCRPLVVSTQAPKTHHSPSVDSPHPNFSPNEIKGFNAHGMPHSGLVEEHSQNMYAFSPTYGSSYPFNGQTQGRRKAGRATQACDACRTRKAKCDEGRPSCSYCRDTAVQCVYKEVPQPKQDRNLARMDQTLARIEMSVNDQKLRDEVVELRNELRSELRNENRELRYENLGLRNEIRNEIRELRDEIRELHRVRVSHSEAHGVLHQGTLIEHSRSQLESMSRPIEEVPRLPAESHRSDEDRMSLNLSVDFREQVPSWAQGESMEHYPTPHKHNTAAHKLLRWQSVQGLMEGYGVNEQYVMELEKDRDPLCPRRKGESHDVDGGGQSGSTNSRSSLSDSGDTPGSQASSSPESSWGTGFGTPRSADTKRFGQDNVGGLNPDGSLKLDPHTLHRLLDSYTSNIHILHPFLHMIHIEHMFRTFSMKYDPGNLTSLPGARPPTASPQPSLGPKRKRSNGTIRSVSTLTSHSKILPDRSIDSALVLLILALGKICEHKDPLPGPVDKTDQKPTCQSFAVHQMQGGSSPGLNRQTSASPHFSFNSATSPYEATWTGSSSRRTSVNGTTPPNVRENGLKNSDVIPGLAYYDYATDILDNLHGGNELSHIQAYLLAGLYAGQLAHVFESHKWIKLAGIAWQELIKSVSSARETDPLRKDLILFAFWTCLLLESDLLAELDLDPSGISNYEDMMRHPHGDHLCGNERNHLMKFYSAQITIRKTLNEAQNCLYKTEETDSPHDGPSSTVFNDMLDQWRNLLPEKWEDFDPPAIDINAARLRAKYYGAKNIVHRRYLKEVIHSDSVNRQDLRDLSQACVEAAMKSTVAFDGLKGRPIVTNIFGTAHAQYGNCLTLAATYLSPLSHLVLGKELKSLLCRTIEFLRNSAPPSPTLARDAEILEHIHTHIFG